MDMKKTVANIKTANVDFKRILQTSHGHINKCVSTSVRKRKWAFFDNLPTDESLEIAALVRVIQKLGGKWKAIRVSVPGQRPAGGECGLGTALPRSQ